MRGRGQLVSHAFGEFLSDGEGGGSGEGGGLSWWGKAKELE